MKQLFLFLFLLLSGSVMAQMPDYGLYNIHITDSAKTVKTQVNPIAGSVTPRSGLLYYWFGGNIIHEQQGGFSGKLLNGIYEESDNHHHLTAQGTFKNGLRNGTWRSWNETGRLSSVITWDEGIKNGKFVYYDANGNETQSGRYDRGLLAGKIIYHTGPDSVKTVVYKNGKALPPTTGSFLKRVNIFKKKKEKATPVTKP